MALEELPSELLDHDIQAFAEILPDELLPEIPPFTDKEIQTMFSDVIT